MLVNHYTPEQINFIKQNVMGRSNAELAEMFNIHFGLDLSINQIKGLKKNRKLSSGLDGRFNPGHIPFNKGKTGFGGWEPTQFKKGNKPHNWVPIGTERLSKDGYIEIKVQDGKLQKNWKGKHIVIWEQHNGPLPKRHAIIFGDGNNRNFDINNLILVSRKQLLTLNQKGLIQSDAQLTKTAVILVDIYHKIGERQK